MFDLKFEQPDFDQWEKQMQPNAQNPGVYENREVGKTWDGRDVSKDNVVEILPNGGIVEKHVTKTSFSSPKVKGMPQKTEERIVEEETYQN